MTISKGEFESPGEASFLDLKTRRIEVVKEYCRIAHRKGIPCNIQRPFKGPGFP